MERRTSDTGKIEIREDGGKPKHLTGYGARYYDGSPGTEFVLWDNKYERAVERIVAGAFDRAAREDDVRGMYNHRQILGRRTAGTMRLAVDSQGLRYEIDIPDTTVGRDVTESVKRGDVTGSSFSFEIPNGGERWTVTTDAAGKRHRLRELLSVNLFDTGPVDFPAYESTTAGVRAAEGVAEARAALDRWEKSHGGPSADEMESRVRLAEAELAIRK